MSNKKYYLGIDTGGTHTDAVVFDYELKSVVMTAKAETTHHDLAIGISEALHKLSRLDWPGGLSSIERIHLSTTLATNAIAERQGRRVGLILMGYDRNQVEVSSLVANLPQVAPVFLAGGHDYYGAETEPLDKAALSAAVQELDKEVTGWAVSGFFSVKNPAHEMEAANLIKSISDKPVTLGRDLTGRLDAVRRAATAALNAGLVVIIGRLLDAVNYSAKQAGISARLMVVKGDGSLVSEEWARAKPIETVVSGPAAGLVGARLLSRGFLNAHERDLWVLDVGGTTSDLALIKDGLPAVNPNGARVGGWETMTMAVETRTRGLGGDSLVAFDKGRVILGPRRVLPLCRLAKRWPKVTDILRGQKSQMTPATVAGCFFLPGAPPDPGLTGDEEDIIRAMEREIPFPMAKFAEEAFEGDHRFIGLKGVEHPAILISAFTPTDAMRILGMYQDGSREAAEIGAYLIGRPFKLEPETVARMTLDEFGRQMAIEITSYGFEKDGLTFRPEDFDDQGLLGASLGRRRSGCVHIGLGVSDPVVLLGAPVAILAPFLSRNLQGRIITPPVFDVASAVGAAASPVYLARRVEIHNLPNFVGYRLFLPDRIIDGAGINELVAVAVRHMDQHMRSLASLAGEDKVEVNYTREDRRAFLNDGSRMDLGAALNFTAAPVKNRFGQVKAVKRKAFGLVSKNQTEDSGPGPGQRAAAGTAIT